MNSTEGNSPEGNDSGVSMRACFRLLAKKGFDVNKWVNEQGQTPLHACTQDGQLEMVDVLLEAKADVHQKDQGDLVALEWAAGCGHANIASLLLKHGAKTHPGVFALHDAAIWGHANVVTVLLEAGADVSEEYAGYTPARHCVVRPKGLVGEMDARLRKGKAEALSAILESGADVNELREGITLLHDAASYNLAGCIAVLVESGLDPNIPSGGGYMNSPLHFACFNGCVDAVRKLHSLGANLGALGSDGRCPLTKAVFRGHDNCVSAMIELGAAVAPKDNKGFSPLHAASAVGQVRCAYLLTESGAPVDALSTDGYSPLMMCMKPDLLPNVRGYGGEYGSKEGRTRVARLLLEMGAKVDAKVMRHAVNGGMDTLLAECMEQSRNISRADRTSSVAIATTLLQHGEGVVFVNLVDRASGKVDDRRYTLNTHLMQYLTKGGVGGNGQSASVEASSDGAAPSSVLSTLLDPASRGFKASDAGASGAGEQGKEVMLRYDGVDFTKEGFGVVVEYLTTGRVHHMLVNQGKTLVDNETQVCEVGVSGDGKSNGGDGDGGSSTAGGRKRKHTSGGGSSGGGEGNAKKKKRCLFDGKLAGQALQAAGYFCLEGMAEEVKRLMDVYGFDYEDEATEALVGGK